MVHGMHVAGTTRRPPAPHAARRRGVTSVLAMVFMVVFSALALGFYAATTTATQVSRNEKTAHEAQLAAESGMQFLRYHLATVSIAPDLTPDEAFEEVYMQLSGVLDNSPTLQGGKVGYQPGVITIPEGDGKFIQHLGNDGGFRAVITQDGQRLKVKMVGRNDQVSIGRGIDVNFAVAQNASNIFNYGVASRGTIALDGNATIKGASIAQAALGSVLSTSSASPTVSLGSNSLISGDISLVNPAGTVAAQSNASIGGSKVPAVYATHIHRGVKEPEFPYIDTSAWEPFATNVLTTVGGTYNTGVLRNIRIKANTNPTFDSNIKVEGVIYIETPNHVKFSSNTEIRGVIVVQNDPTGSPGTGPGQNSISMTSNVKMYGVDTLPATADFPPDLRALKGAAILAPRFYLHFNSNFGSVGGAVIGDRMEFDSNARGTVRGSVINLSEGSVHMDSNSVISIESMGTTEYPAGVFFGYHFTPLGDTYQEVAVAKSDLGTKTSTGGYTGPPPGETGIVP